MDEYWGTFSIVDHRHPLYRQSLALFDRVVIPILAEPTDGITQNEIDQLDAEASYLEDNGAAIRYEWLADEYFDDPPAYATVTARSLADRVRESIGDDRYYGTREMLAIYAPLKKPKGVESVTAVPVFPSSNKYEATLDEISGWSGRLNVELLQRLPLPAPNSSFEDLIRLRERESFQRARLRLRHWQMSVLPEIMAAESSSASLRAALRDFDNYVADYRSAMEVYKGKKVEVAVCSVVVIGAYVLGHGVLSAAVAAMAPLFFKMKEVIRPSWRELGDKNCAIAAMVYEAENNF